MAASGAMGALGRLWLVSAVLVTLALCRNADAAIDPALVTLSGLSSGAFAAVQFSVAFSSSLRGVGVVAGGPYWCAMANVDLALALASNADLVCARVWWVGGWVGSLCRATGDCSKGGGGGVHAPPPLTAHRPRSQINVSVLWEATSYAALADSIDSPSNLALQRVYLFSGQKDTKVVPGVMVKLQEYYS
jgi:hypothetical protein